MNRHLLAIASLLGFWALCQSPISQATELPSGPLSPTPQKAVLSSPPPIAKAPAKARQYTLPQRYRGVTIRHRDARLNEKVIALTFDDGPNAELTPLVLKTLAQYKAKATFFVMGQWAQEYPGLVAQEAADGHAVESHSYSHPTEDISLQHAARELERTQTIIEQNAGAKPRLFRPPYGNLNWSMAKVAAKEGYCVVKWTICGSDSPAETASEIVENVTKSPVSGDIVLLHDGRCHNATIKALPEILRRLSAKGFRFVTVPQLLKLWDTAKSAPTTARRAKATAHQRAA